MSGPVTSAGTSWDSQPKESGGMKGNIVTGSARINGRKVSVTYDVPLFDPPNIPPPRPTKGAASHDRDFAWVDWFGVIFEFVGPQRAVVRHLWKACVDGIGGVHQSDLLDGADANLTRLRDLFRAHPAWETMIVQDLDGEPGTYKLSRQV
jgi:hypothetical protein